MKITKPEVSNDNQENITTRNAASYPPMPRILQKYFKELLNIASQL